ncbi:MAG: aminotransferase class I/II-fold pyridoxal phosphate-dependent enzyme, partial [Deltaproteobacteria bacterium]|nr:aminotransferase class I/II-fold pyridoxal phosphate-dependent enzyme [Deltaproteobacteria bacterium]
MTISRQIATAIKNSNWIRKMFEEGNRRIEKYGHENVFDLSIGNPVFEPPPLLRQKLLEILKSDLRGTHRYMPNAGYDHTREYISEKLGAETSLAFNKNDIVMTVGAGGGLNVILKTLLNPGEEVLVLKPHFMEYIAYSENHSGRVSAVRTTDEFHLDFSELEKGLRPETKAVLINSPNNPTGVVYSKDELNKLGDLLRNKSVEYSKPITLICDEPYKKILYIKEIHSVFHAY